MFTYNNWDKFCSTIRKNNHCCTRAMDIISVVKKNKKFIILKHDVETNVKKALIFAKIEHKYKISGTFYIQEYLLDNPKNIKILNQIKQLGHEVAYHYDIMDSNGGDWQKATSEFIINIEKFKKFGFKIKTICPHGNPVMIRNGWSSNKDFFRNEKIKNQFNKIIDIVINFHQEIIKEYLYISDTGYNWQLITNIANDDQKNSKPNKKINNLEGVIRLTNNQNSLIISIHPHRWSKYTLIMEMRILMFKIVKNCIKFIAKNNSIKKILNKFYYLAKKI